MPDEPRFLYIHIAKTGGVTFRQVLEDNCKASEIFHCSLPEDIMKYDDSSLHRYRLVHGHFNLGETHHLTGFKRVTTLRAPIERCISAYNFWSTLDADCDTWSHQAKARIRAAQSRSLADMIHHPDRLIWNTFHNLQTRILSSEMDSEARLTEKHLQQAIQALQQFDFIGLNSELELSMQLLSHKFGLFLPVHINTLNRTSRRDRPDTATLAMLKEANQLDAKLLEWANRRGLYRLNRIPPPALAALLSKLKGWRNRPKQEQSPVG